MPSYSQEIPVNQTFSSDTIFAPFTGSTAVYSLKAYGNVNLYSDSSLVRIVLVDSYGNHWLVFESYPLITDTSSFVFSAECDETCFLDGIMPDSIRIDLISAFITLDSLKLDTNYISNATELQAQAKWNSDSVKIAVMNQRIVEGKMYWRAGRTSISSLSFSSKEQHRDCNDNDIESGPYEMDPDNPIGLYSCIPNDCETKDGFIDIYGTQTWSAGIGDKHLDSGIMIHSGAQLIINCQVFLTSGITSLALNFIPTGTYQVEHPCRIKASSRLARLKPPCRCWVHMNQRSI